MTLAEVPRTEAWMSKHQVTFRQNTDHYLQKAVELGILPEIKDIKYFQMGESSVVAKAKLDGDPVVIKLSASHNVAAEGHFLKKWSESGVKTPSILNIHSGNEELPVSILVMEYINALPLSEAATREELIANGTWRYVGRILAIMHQVQGNNFGFPKGNDWERGPHITFTQSINKLLFEDRVPYLVANGILDDKTVALVHKAAAILEKDSQDGRKPSLIHGDYMPYNMFATNPPTIFDPLPEITHPYMCLGYPIFKLMTLDPRIDVEHQQLLAGYEEVTLVDRYVLSAAIVIRGIGKLKTWIEKGKTKNAQRIKYVLAEQAKLLG